MWEYSITLPISKSNKTQKLYYDICNLFKNVGGVVTTISSKDDYTILVACKVEDSFLVKSKLIEIICNYIVLDYKYNYLVKNFKFKVTQDINMQAFIKALVVFDSEIDKDIIRSQLKPLNKVNIDSFYNFKLKTLKTKWKDLVSLANDNFIYLMKSETFIELLKFIISNLDYRTKVVNVKIDNNNFYLSDANNRPIQDLMLGDMQGCSDAFLVTTLITLSPQKINLCCDTNIKNSTINLLFELFSDRIEILK